MLPTEIWGEIVKHTMKKDVLKFEATKNDHILFKIIVNNSICIFYNPNLPIVKRNLQKLIDNIDKIAKTCWISEMYNRIIINIDSAKNVFNIELESLYLTSTYTMELEKNKEMIVKFLTDFRDAL